MRLPKFLPAQKKLKALLIVRRVVGSSMLPALYPGQLVWASSYYKSLQPGDVVIVSHEKIEKIKRIKSIDGTRFYLEGDNKMSSTDSRHFGTVSEHQLLAKVFVFNKGRE